MFDETPTTRPKKRKGFACISPERRREIASKGGRSAHAQGRAHQFTSEEAAAAGHKGGKDATASGNAHRFTPEEASAAGKKGINQKLNGHTNRTIHIPAPTRKELPTMSRTDLTPNTELTVQQLAAVLGPRRAGQPTSPETIRSWCLRGVQGVVLESRLEVSVRIVRWGDYLRFRENVEHVKNQRRRSRKETALNMGRRAEKKREKRKNDAIAELKRLGAI